MVYGIVNIPPHCPYAETTEVDVGLLEVVDDDFVVEPVEVVLVEDAVLVVVLFVVDVAGVDETVEDEVEVGAGATPAASP